MPRYPAYPMIGNPASGNLPYAASALGSKASGGAPFQRRTGPAPVALSQWATAASRSGTTQQHLHVLTVAGVRLDHAFLSPGPLWWRFNDYTESSTRTCSVTDAASAARS